MSKTDTSANSETSSSNGDGDAIKVYVRVRPPAQGEEEADRNWCLDIDQSANAIIMKAKPEAKVFTFDHVADINTAQEAVFCTVGKKIIESCVAGYNGTIFAYGQTGSGKTFTMLGPSEDADNFQHEMRGIIPRSFEYLFGLIKREHDMHGEKKEFLCKCSFLEIYNEQVYDLLDSTSSSLHLRENIKKGVYVSGIIEQAVTSAMEAYHVLNSGWLNRRVASTSMNRESSRSHAVFTLQIESKVKKGAIEKVRCSQLNLVDLAGSERQKDTNTVGIRLKEAGSINKSLSTLGNVIMALVDTTHGKSRHVPYRESKLTFLLRDSLGGNAKTQLIACVHPSSKCFGETLSTLQFARRAKMIKNKAVVNEDSHGSIVHLQAEVRRLKELLAQCQNGSIPSNPNVSDMCTPGPDAAAQTAKSDSTWRKNFIHAMFFREKSEQEKRVLSDTISKLEDLGKKKEKFLQSTKMIVKFRENHIANLIKTDKNGGSGDAEDNRITDLQEELKLLTDQVQHNPELTRYAMENQHLKAELRKLKGQETTSQHVMVDSQRIAELEKIFRELLMTKKNGDEKEVSVLSTPHTGENNVAVATLEKYKSQVEKLQNEIENLKEKLQDQKRSSQKALMNAAGEMASYKKTVFELEKVLKATQLKNKIERETINDIHVQTIKTITTPTKACYNLRNRTILARMSGTVLDLDASLTLDPGEEPVFLESQPPQMAEQMAEALTDEIKTLQDSNIDLRQKVEDNEGEMIRLRQTVSKLESENDQLNEILKKERTDWSEKEEEITTELVSARDVVKQSTESARIAKEESEDLNLMLHSVDKEIASLKGRTKENQKTRDQAFSLIEAKLFKVEMALSELKLNNDKLTEEKHVLQESCDNAQTTISFHESQIVDLEELLRVDRAELKKIHAELETTYGKLVTEKDKNEQMQSQMQNEGKEQETEILRLMEEISGLQAHKSNVQNMFDAQSESLSLLTKELDVSRVTMTSQEKQLAENKDAMIGLMAKVQELKASSAQGQELNMSLEAQVEDGRQQASIQQQTCEDQSIKINSLKAQLNDIAEQMEQKSNAHNVELSVMKDELECAMEAYEKLQEELQARQKLLEEAQAESEKLTDQLQMSRQEVSIKSSEVERVRSEFSQKLEELENRIQPKQLENEELCELLTSKDDEISRYRVNQERLQQLLDEFEVSRKEKNEEIISLKFEVAQADLWKTEMDTWWTKHKSMEFELESLKITSEEKQKEQQEQMVRYQNELQVNTKKLSELQDCLQKTSVQNSKLQIELTESQEAQQESVEEGERLQSLAEKDHDEKQELVSKLEALQGDNTRLNKECTDLHERLMTVEEENAKLVGHQNPKQKIQFHLAVKEENFQLREQVVKLTSELARFKTGKTASHESALKENITHLRRTPGKLQVTPGKTVVPSKNITPARTTATTKYVTPGRVSAPP